MKTIGTERKVVEWSTNDFWGDRNDVLTFWRDGDGIPHAPQTIGATLATGGAYEPEDAWTTGA